MATMEAAGVAPERVEGAQAKVAARVGAMAVVTRTEAAADQSLEGTGTTWVWVARAAVGVVKVVAGEAHTCRTRPGMWSGRQNRKRKQRAVQRRRSREWVRHLNPRRRCPHHQRIME